ncbi:AAA family ATPase [Pseudalkalibacillus sp. Hm43]|uniref:AAA family ATPase n=1 Tax=Pseudalkalibacillus sp. Hm43 TaxID=3450742 RepID=UPI003F4293C5
MRPIHLSVAGLHSFREKQDVDFQTLCKGGVFGIFGPTGSGKSSLLDAVTLALYGKVERASNTIQGIMNHAEDQLNVSFSFELGDPAFSKCYKVERTFKRHKNDTIRTSTCRLIEVIHEEHVVLADKERDVTAEVEQILGLTLTDFTRAVVLPQGKFAEFLSLKGAERRQMLQRLFRLEQYGDLLNQRLKSKVEETNMILKEIVAEQQGLGEASTETLKDLEQRLNQALQAVEIRNKELEKKEVQFEHYRQIWKWQEELNDVKAKLNELHEQEPEIERLKKRLKTAQEADLLHPYVQELEELLGEQKEWNKKKTKLEQETEQLKAQVESSHREVQTIQKDRSEHEPKLYERLQELKQAKELEQERNPLLEKIQTEQKMLQQKQEELKTGTEELDKLQEQKKKAIRKQAEIKQEIEAKTITYEQRNRLREAMTLKRDTITLKQTREELLSEHQKTVSAINRLHSETEKQHRQLKKAKEKLGYLLQHTEIIYNRVCEHERVIERAKSGIEQFLKESKDQQQKYELHTLSAQIAEQLQNGEKCPVCGSIDHPEPVSNTNDQHDHTVLIEELEQLYTDVKNEEVTISHNKKDLEYLFEALQEYVQKDEIQGDEIAAASFDPIQNKLQSTEELKRYLKLLQTETKGFKQDLLELREKRNNYTSIYGEHDKLLLENKSSLANEQRELEKIEQKKKDIETQLHNLSEQWQANYQTIPYEQVEQLQKEMDEQEQLVAGLNSRYDKSVSFLYEQDEKITKTSEDVQTKRLEFSSAESEVQTMNKRLNELQHRIDELCGEKKADDLIHAVQNEMAEWKQQEEAALKRNKEATVHLQDSDKELEVAKSTVHQTESRLRKAEERWTEKVDGTSFETKEQVKEALILSGRQKEWEQEIEQFNNEKQKYAHEQTRLRSLLNHKEVSESEWEAVQIELKNAKQAKEDALSEKARLEGEWSDTKKRAEKYGELEKKRLENEELSERLGKLQAVFRGNSFVEYIAEEQLHQVARDASQRLGELTRQRYALEVDSAGGFVIRDDANGGVRRPVTSLSGGETFLTSLALALSLSAQIQLQGQYPLEFFFLDEGFGTLDQSLLDTVISALERLQMQQVSVGVISHVPELRARLPRKLIVEPATPAGKGSSVSIKTL